MSCSAFVGGCPDAARSTPASSRRASLGARVEAFDEAGRSVVGRDRRARPDRAAAVDAGLLLERPRRDALPRELLRDVPGRLAPRRLDPDHRARQRGHRGPLGLDAQPRRASASGRASCTASWSVCPEVRRQPRHRARAARTAGTGCRCSWSSPTVSSSTTRSRRGSTDDDPRRRSPSVTSRTTIVAVPAIPRTLTGKKMEVPVKRLLLGRPLAEVAAPGAVADPHALDFFVEYADVVKAKAG